MCECKSICENSRCLVHCEVKKHIKGLLLLATLVSYKRRTSQYSCYDIFINSSNLIVFYNIKVVQRKESTVD